MNTIVGIFSAGKPTTSSLTERAKEKLYAKETKSEGLKHNSENCIFCPDAMHGYDCTSGVDSTNGYDCTCGIDSTYPMKGKSVRSTMWMQLSSQIGPPGTGHRGYVDKA